MMAAEGAVYPIEDVMNDHGFTLDKQGFLPAVISYYQTPEGKLLFRPFNSSTPVMWYNKDAFAKAGITKVPETWDEVETAAEKLVAAGYDSGLSFGWQSWVMIENFSAWHNLAIGTRENGFAGLDTRFKFNNPGVKNMLERIDGWHQNKLFQYGGRRGDSLPLFINEKCAIQQLNLNTPTPNSRGVRFGNFVQIRDIINDELEAVCNNSKTAAAAMDDAVEKSNKLLEKFEKANK